MGLVCAVVSQVFFSAIYSNAIESFGGSGYIFALCGFGLVMQILVPDFPKIEFGTWSGNWLVIYLILSNIPMLPSINGATIVFHLVSFVLGGGAAFVCRLLGI